MGWRDQLGGVVRGAAGIAGSALLGIADSTLGKASGTNAAHESDGSVAETSGGPVPTEQADDPPKSMMWDPFAVVEQLGYKERPSQVSYGTLRAMVQRMPIAQAIIQNRVNQVASFCAPQRNRHQIGFRIALRDTEAEPTSRDLRWIKEMEALLLRTGLTENPRGRQNFETFLRKFTTDALILDQGAFEVVPNRKGEPAEFYAVDGATMRLADTAKAYIDEDLDDQTRYVQIYDGLIVNEYTASELCFGIRNPKSDIRSHGYGTSELEMAVTVITNMLHSWQYNQNFFTQGAAQKGILNFKGAIPESEMRSFRRHWYQMLSGVENCVAGDTKIWTQESGAISVSDAVGDKESKEVRVWTGTVWRPALVYRTKESKRSWVTTLGCGLRISTSPDHRFKVIGETGEPAWKTQAELEIGDFVAVNALPPASTKTPEYKGQPVNADLMETLGWLVRDGSLFYAGRGHAKTNAANWFYSTHEESIRTRHLGVLSSYGLEPTAKETVRSEEKRAELCAEYGFRTVESVAARRIELYSVDFVEWLLGMGFKTSKDKRGIPGFVHTAPLELKRAFLRGVFSADGNNAKGRSPCVTISDQTTRDQVRLLLMSIGIRCTLSEGKTKYSFTKGKVDAESVLRVKDRDAFFDKVGFIQDHKQPGVLNKPNESGKTDRVAHVTVLRYLRLVRAANDASDKTLLSKRERMDMNSILSGQDTCSRGRLLRFMRVAAIPVPEWLTSYHFEPVLSKIDTGVDVPMFDLQVYDDDHQFMASGICVHNSWRTPITNAEEIQWIGMQTNNRDMEFSAWMDFQIKVLCGLYAMDPIELNFKYGNSGQKSAMQDAGNKEKIIESKERGLRPLLRFIATCLNQHIVWPINENFEFQFVGLDALTRQDVADLNSKRVKTSLTVNELRAEDDKPPIKGGDIILDSTFLQNLQGMAASEQQNAMGGGGEPGEGQEPRQLTEGDADGDGEFDYEEEQPGEDENAEGSEVEQPTEKSLRPRNLVFDVKL